MSTTRTLFAGLPALLAASLAGAQTPAPAYQSAFDGYKPFAAGDVHDWRKSNDTARGVGGWRAYAREIQDLKPAEPPRADAAAPAASGTKPADPHMGHHK